MKNILIDCHHSENKVCVVGDGVLEEFWLERCNTQKRVGNVYKGKVMNVLQGMQACFVDIGLGKNAFLYAGDVCVDGELLSSNGEAPDHMPLKVGDIIMCQVLKDEFGSKGCRVSMNISLPSHNLVMAPYTHYICLSRKIEDPDKKAELEQLVDGERQGSNGYIIRTEAECATHEEIVQDMRELEYVWSEIKRKMLVMPTASMLYSDGELIFRTMRDILRTDIDRVIVNDQEMYQHLLKEYKCMLGEGCHKLELYNKVENMLSHYGVSQQIDALAERVAPLSNGAYLVIDRTEALTVVDVNTGKYVGEVNLEETVYITNKIAAKEIARQLRLRNIGGIVVIDFIDMKESEHKEEILSILKEEFAKDRTKCMVIGMSELGLVQVTRKKTRNMIDEMLLQTCPYCNGTGVVFSEENIIMKIRDYLMEIFSVNKRLDAIKLYVNDKVFAKLFSLRYLEKECSKEWSGKRIYVIPQEHYHIEKFDVVKVTTNIIDLPDSAKLLY